MRINRDKLNTLAHTVADTLAEIDEVGFLEDRNTIRQEARKILETLLTEAESCESIDRWSDLNRSFHEALYQPCARPRLLNLIASLNANVERYIRLLVSQSNYRLQAQQEHRAILASARVRNPASLAALVAHPAVETAVQLRQFLLLHQENKSRADRKKTLRRSA